MTQNPDQIVSRGKGSLQSRWKQKLRSVATIFIFNISLFLLLGSYVIYRTIVPANMEAMIYVKTQTKPTPPPRPPAKGGEASRSLEDPSALIVPPSVSPPSVITTSVPSTISFKSQMQVSISSVTVPSLALPSGSGFTQGTTRGGVSRSNPFGDNQDSGVPGLTGELYDLKQTPEGNPTPIAIVPPETVDALYPDFQSLPATQKGLRVLRSYVRGWDQSILEQYLKAPIVLQTTQIFIPVRLSEEATKVFGVADKVKARHWVIHYHGKICASVTGKFRFLGFGDDFLVVRIGEQNVLDGS